MGEISQWVKALASNTEPEFLLQIGGLITSTSCPLIFMSMLNYINN